MEIVLLNTNSHMPTYGSNMSAGMDVYAAECVGIAPNTSCLVGLGIAIRKMPEGCYGRLAPRSGLSSKHSTHVGAGVVDRDYRGEVKVLLFNHHMSKTLYVAAGDRIAQLIMERYEMPTLKQVDVTDLDTGETQRGTGGFGSTGI